MSIGKNNGGNVEGKIINANESAVRKATSIKTIEKGNNIELKTVEREEDRDKKIEELKKVMDKMDERNEEKNNEGNKDNKNKDDKKENKFRAFEVKDDAVSVEMGDFLDDKDSDVITMISIDSDGKTYGDDKLDYEQLGLKLIEAQDALDRLEKKKEKLPPANKFLETIRKAFSNEYTINSEINKMMVSKATQGIGRLEKRIEYLEGRISKELS
jgi:hypothetical protein